jgi:hypothetical protein
MEWSRWMIRAAGILLVVTTTGALVVHMERPRRVEVPLLLGAGLGGVPVVAGAQVCVALPIHVFLVALGVVCAVGTLLGTAGCWLGRLRTAPCQHPVGAFVGTLVGALIGSVLCAATICAIIAGDTEWGLTIAVIAAGLVGSCGTLGFQLGAGGPGSTTERRAPAS